MSSPVMSRFAINDPDNPIGPICPMGLDRILGIGQNSQDCTLLAQARWDCPRDFHTSSSVYSALPRTYLILVSQRVTFDEVLQLR